MANRFRRCPTVLRFFALASPLIVAVHCGGDPAASSEADGGADNSGGDDGSNFVSDDAGAVTSTSEGGTIDTGSDASAITVCGGSKGNPGAVPLLDWAIYTLKSKYAVKLGSQSDGSEPGSWSSSLAVVDGTTSERSLSIGGGTGGKGLDTPGLFDKYRFSEATMPKTDTALRTLGWSATLEFIFDLRTVSHPSGWKDYRVTGRGLHASSKQWVLAQPRRTQDADDSKFYVSGIEAHHGYGWFFTVAFDAACKATAFDALVGANPLGILDPKAPHTRAEVSQFLVDNNAKLTLSVVTFGAEDPGVKAAVDGTNASSATLDALDATLTALDSALTASMNNPGPVDYATIAAGTNARWVTGAVNLWPISALDP